jgi:hypothetical protein
LWSVLGKEIELYEHTEFTGAADSWLRAFLGFVAKNEGTLNNSTFVPLLKDNFLTQPQYVKYKRFVFLRLFSLFSFRDIRFTADNRFLEASRGPVQLRHIGAANQSRAMRLFRHLAHTSTIPSGVYADFFQVWIFIITSNRVFLVC